MNLHTELCRLLMLGTSRVQPTQEFWELAGIDPFSKNTVEKKLLDAAALHSHSSRIPLISLEMVADITINRFPFAPKKTYFFYKKQILNHLDVLLPEFCYLLDYYGWQLNPLLTVELFKSNILQAQIDGSFLYTYIPEQLENLKSYNRKYSVKKEFVDPDPRKSPELKSDQLSELLEGNYTFIHKLNKQALLHLNPGELGIQADSEVFRQILATFPEYRDQWLRNLIAYDEKEMLNQIYKEFLGRQKDEQKESWDLTPLLQAIPEAHFLHIIREWSDKRNMMQMQGNLLLWIKAAVAPFPASLSRIISEITNQLSEHTLQSGNIAWEWVEATILKIHPDQGLKYINDLPAIFHSGQNKHRQHRWAEIINLRREMYLMMSAVGHSPQSRHLPNPPKNTE